MLDIKFDYLCTTLLRSSIIFCLFSGDINLYVKSGISSTGWDLGFNLFELVILSAITFPFKSPVISFVFVDTF